MQADFRATADLRNEKLSAKVRDAQLMKVPYMGIIGDKEVEDKTITPRLRSGKNLSGHGAG